MLLLYNHPAFSVELSYWGVFYGVMASFCVSLNAILTKRTLPVVDNSVWLLTYYNNINAAFLFLPLIFFNGEIGTLISFPYIGFASFWVAMNFAGVLGISIAYVTGITCLSPFFPKIEGVFRFSCREEWSYSMVHVHRFYFFACHLCFLKLKGFQVLFNQAIFGC